MRLITHNMLQCNIKGVKNGFPLGIEAGEVRDEEAEFNPEFVKVTAVLISKMLLRSRLICDLRCRT